MNKLCAYLDVFEQRNLSVNVFPLNVVWLIFLVLICEIQEFLYEFI